MTKLVRATNPVTGATFTTSEAHAKRAGAKYTSQGATDRYGRIRPAATRTDLGEQSSTGSSTPSSDKKGGGK